MSRAEDEANNGGKYTAKRNNRHKIPEKWTERKRKSPTLRERGDERGRDTIYRVNLPHGLTFEMQNELHGALYPIAKQTNICV